MVRSDLPRNIGDPPVDAVAGKRISESREHGVDGSIVEGIAGEGTNRTTKRAKLGGALRGSGGGSQRTPHLFRKLAKAES
ncbi:MAG: hypothetical protein WAU39_17180 [Polyangiales bacterium]